MKLFKDGFLIVLIMVIVATLAGDVFAFTSATRANVQTSGSIARVEKTNVVCLLSWQDNKMVTTQGTFYLSTDITVINQSGLKTEDVVLQKNPPIVQIDKVGRQIRTITILPNTQ